MNDVPTFTPTPRHERFFNAARRNMKKSTYIRYGRGGRVSIGSVIVKGNYVISGGVNQRKTHVVQHMYNVLSAYYAPTPNIHAEVDALIKSKNHDLTGAEVYVYREHMDGELASCRPCTACMRALKDAGVQHIYYTSGTGFHYECIRD